MSPNKGKRFVYESNVAKKARLHYPPLLIKDIHEKVQNFNLTVRVLYKRAKLTKKGDFCFNFVLMDSTGFIILCGWADSESDNPMQKGLEVGKCYEIKGNGVCEFPNKSKNYSWVRHDYQLIFNYNQIEIVETGNIDADEDVEPSLNVEFFDQ